MVQFTMPPIKAMQSQAPPRKSTFIKPRKHHVASNDKATIVHHLLKQSQPTKKNTNTSTSAHPKRIAFIYGALAQGNPYHWLLKAAIATSHARYLGSAKTAKRFSFAWGPFLLHRPKPLARAQYMQGKLYELDAVALNLLDNVHGMTDELFLRQTIDVTSKNLALYEDIDDVAAPDCDDLVLQVEAYFADPLSTLGLSTFMTRCPPVAHLKNGVAEFLHREDELRWQGVLNERVERWIEAQHATNNKPHMMIKKLTVT